MKLSLNGEWKLRYCLETEHMPAPETCPEISAQVPGGGGKGTLLRREPV